MSTPDVEREARERGGPATAARNGAPVATGGGRRRGRAGSGAEGSRRRGAVLRRLLALGDWAALVATLAWSPRRAA